MAVGGSTWTSPPSARAGRPGSAGASTCRRRSGRRRRGRCRARRSATRRRGRCGRRARGGGGGRPGSPCGAAEGDGMRSSGTGRDGRATWRRRAADARPPGTRRALPHGASVPSASDIGVLPALCGFIWAVFCSVERPGGVGLPGSRRRRTQTTQTRGQPCRSPSRTSTRSWAPRCGGVLDRPRRAGGQPGAPRGGDRAASLLLEGDGGPGLAGHPPARGARGCRAGLSELVVVLDELGRQVAPGPFLPTVLASAVIAQCGSEEQQAALLPGLADGSVVAALGLGGSLTARGRGARRRRRDRPRRSGGRPRAAAGR